MNAVVGAATVSTPGPGRRVGLLRWWQDAPDGFGINGRTLYRATRACMLAPPGGCRGPPDDPAASVDSKGLSVGGTADIVATDVISGISSTALSVTIA